jgi:hypothetical protein
MRYGTGLLGPFLGVLCFSAQAVAQPSVALLPDQGTVALPPQESRASGAVAVTLSGIAPTEVTLKATPLSAGEAHGFVHFPENDGHDTIRLDTPALNCATGATCSVPYFVTDLWPAGSYSGTFEADAWKSGQRLASASISVVRLPSSFHPVIASDQMHDGRISVDVDGTTPTTFLLSVQNPAGSAPHQVELLACPEAGVEKGCAPPGQQGTPRTVSFQPTGFWLPPGSSQTVSVTVQPCPTLQPCASTMIVMDGSGSGEAVPTLISVNQHSSSTWRQLWLLFATVLGSLVSLVLNNLFPTVRAKQSAREAIEQIERRLKDCLNAGNALLDILNSERTRLKLVLHQISFTNPAKQADLQGVRQATAGLLEDVELARHLSLLRADADGAILPIKVHAALRAKLLEAEEALCVSDKDSATSRLNEAQAILVQAKADTEQKNLGSTLGDSIRKLIQERGVRRAPPPGAPAGTPPPALEQPPQRNRCVSRIIEQLDADAQETQASPRDLLDTEHDFYIADVWTEYMERKLDEFHEDNRPPQEAQAWDDRRKDWIKFSEILLDCLRKIPSSDQTQLLINLLRHDTTLGDIERALQEKKGHIKCDPNPKYLDPIEVAFVVTDPSLSNIAAVRQLLSYNWSFGDGTSPPPNVDRCTHYFKKPRPRLAVRRWRVKREPAPVSYDVSVSVTIPFSKVEPVKFTDNVKPRVPQSLSVSRVTDGVGFAVTAAVAVITAFGTKYATSLPNVVGWGDCLTAFLLGFGLDQLRDTVMSSAPSRVPSDSRASVATSAVPGAAPGMAAKTP